MVGNNLSRTLILGNGGSGKSWLAERLASRLAVPTFDLDLVHWEPGGFNQARDKSVAINMVRQIAAENESWIIEGVYGWLAVQAISRATALIWLDIDEAECIENARARGMRRGGDDASFAAMLTWIGEYRERRNANSFLAHQNLFTAFNGFKVSLRNRSEMASFLDTGIPQES